MKEVLNLLNLGSIIAPVLLNTGDSLKNVHLAPYFSIKLCSISNMEDTFIHPDGGGFRLSLIWFEALGIIRFFLYWSYYQGFKRLSLADYCFFWPKGTCYFISLRIACVFSYKY